MKKIVYFFVPMKKMGDENLLDYGETGNVKSACHQKVRFGLNAALAGEIKADDDVKLVLVRTMTKKDELNANSLENIELFKAELSSLLGKKIEPVVIEGEFSETKADMEKVYRALLGELEEEAEIYADTTFGPRLNLMIIMNVLNFAQRFFDADIKLILNSKVLFDKDNKPIDGSQELFDVSPFYYLNNLTNTMQASDGKEALKALDAFFKL